MDERVHGLPVDPPLRQGLDFLLAAHGLCSIARLNRLLDGTRAESSAEHSWHLALTALVLAPRVAPDVDLARVVEMIVLHDLVEVEAGDVPIYDEQARLDVVVAEQAALARLFARLPAEEGERLLRLWHEAEEVRSDEARFAKALDRLQPLLLHRDGDGRVWVERDVTLGQERRLMAVIEQYWPQLGPVAAALIDDTGGRGMLRRSALVQCAHQPLAARCLHGAEPLGQRGRRGRRAAPTVRASDTGACRRPRVGR